jgi:hypothetical protein
MTCRKCSKAHIFHPRLVCIPPQPIKKIEGFVHEKHTDNMNFTGTFNLLERDSHRHGAPLAEWITHHLAIVLAPMASSLVQSVLTHLLFTLPMFVLTTLFVQHREYTSQRNGVVVESVGLLVKQAVMCLGTRRFMKGTSIPTVIIGRTYVAHVEMVASDMGPNDKVVMNVWSLRMFNPPIADEKVSTPHISKENTITVMYRDIGMKDCFNVSTRIERTLRPGCPTKAVSEGVVRYMKGLFCNGDGNVFILCGSKGTGKSSSLRILAGMLGAHLYRMNPCTPYESINGVLDYVYESSSVVLGIEEFDVTLDKFGTIDTSDGPVQVSDKQSWNQMLDDVANIPNVVLVLTTNRTPEELAEYDESLLRPGRVTRVIAFDDILGGMDCEACAVKCAKAMYGGGAK